MHIVTTSGLNMPLLMSESVLVLLSKVAEPSQSLNVAHVPYHSSKVGMNLSSLIYAAARPAIANMLKHDLLL